MDSVYKVIEIIGSSPDSWDVAGKNAVERASVSLRDDRVAEVLKQDMVVENGKVAAYRVRLTISFKVEADEWEGGVVVF